MANRTVKSRILIRNDTAALWTSTNPILLKGEFGVEIDTRRFKVGDGVQAWNSLSYAGSSVELKTAPPTAADKSYEIGTTWLDTSTGRPYVLNKVVGNIATWSTIALTEDLTLTSLGAGDMLASHYANGAGNVAAGYVNKARIADKWATSRSITLTGAVTGSGSMDGSDNLSFAVALKNSTVVAGDYTKVSVDAKGIVTAGALLTAGDIPNIGVAQVDGLAPAATTAIGTSAGNLVIRGANGYVDKALIADKWTTPRKLSFTGDITGESNVDGSAPVATAMTLANSGVTAGTYAKMTVDAKGRVTAGMALAATDIPPIEASTQVTGLGTAAFVATGTIINTIPLRGTNGYLDKALIADKWTTARILSFTGDVTGQGSVDGSKAVATALTLKDSGVTAGTYTKMTVDAKGRVTSGTALAKGDIPKIDFSQVNELGTAAKLNTGTADGNIPVLTAGGKLPDGLIPKLAITEVHVVATQAAMLALVAEPGDIAVRSDISQTYILKTSPATVLGNWVELRTQTGVVTSVNSFSGAVTLKTSHIAEETNLYYTEARATANFTANKALTTLAMLSDGVRALRDDDILILNGGLASATVWA